MLKSVSQSVWSLNARLCVFSVVCCAAFRVSVGVDFQEELSDMLLLKMLQAATQASADKDRVRVQLG